MTELPDNILHLPQYQVLGCKSTDDEMHFQVDVPDPIACEECGVQGEFVRFGKRDVPYRDLPIHGKRVTLWVVRRRYTCRACKTTFRPQLPEMVDGFRMTLRLHEYVEKESFNHPYTFVAAQTGLDEKTVRDIFNARAEFLGRWHRFETPRILGIDELYLNKRYRCILTNIEERTLLDLPDNILHLPEYQVLGCKSTDDEMHFQVDAPDPIACEECGVQGEFVRFGKRDVPYRDLPIHGKRVTLWVVRRRYTCRACKTTFRPQLPEMVDGFRMTLRLHEYVEKESFNHPYTFVAAQTGLDEKTVRDIFNARAEFLGRWHRFETPRILGIDELYLNKRYRCILTNIEERTLLDLLATRRQDVVTNYLMKLKDRQKVEIVSMDMWNPYRAAVKAVLPQARIVVDKFHVVRMANDALERVRKGLRKELKPSQSRTLKGDRKILLKRAHEVSDRERLIMETWTGAFPQLLAAYEHKERFYGIWDATTRLQAEAALDEWIATIPKGQKEVWSDLVRAVGNWREETMTYFETDMPVTNAYTESINRLAKDKNREGRGYSFEVMRARMLYTTKHKKKAPTAKVSPFYKKTIGYGLPDFAEELNYGVDLSTI